MTLMPVSSTFTSVSCSVNAGAGRWMAMFFSDTIGPRPSTGRPTTFMIRPKAGEPTGMVIGRPVSLAAMPRTRPSVWSMATVRTTLSPKC